MSGTFDKKSDGASRRLARAQKERLEKRKTRIIAISVISVLAVLFAGALFMNSKFARRSLPAMTVSGVNFSAAEFEYFYYNAYYEYKEYVNSQMGEYASQMLPQNDRPPFSTQMNYATGTPWSDTFVEIAIENMSKLVRTYNAAMAAGFTLSDDARSQMESDIEAFMIEAQVYGYTFDSYLQAIFGPNVNEAVFRRISELMTISNEFSLNKRDSFSYSAAERTAYYEENKDTLDVFSYRYFLVRAETVVEEDFATTEEYEEAKAAALSSAFDRANEIIDGIENEDDFIAAAKEYDEAQFDEPDSTLRHYPGSWLGNDYGPWMMEPEREYGDVFACEYSNGAYAVFFISRDSNEYRLTSMRQLLFLKTAVDPEEFLLGEEDPEYLLAVEEADAEARTRAEEVLQRFIEAGSTEAALLELTSESDDSTEGGLYEDISMDVSHFKMVDEIQDWLFAPEREFGDSELIRTEAYGYHLIFFMGHGERYCDYIADNKMRDRDFTAWNDGLEPVEAVRRWAFMLTQL